MREASIGSTIGVLTSVYSAVQADHFRQSLESILSQTRPPDEIVIVIDGPISGALRGVLLGFLESASDELPESRTHTIDLAVNVGAGPARQAGLTVMSSTYVAIQDADDISHPDRLDRMIHHMGSMKWDLAGSALAEFQDGEPEARRIRRYAATDPEIRRAARMNNPIGHPSLVIRRESALAVGGYEDLPGNEDYDLVARMLAHGQRAGNLEVPLVDFRMESSVFARRGGLKIVRAELQLSHRLVSYGIIGRIERVPILASRLAYRMAPQRVKAYLYTRVVA